MDCKQCKSVYWHSLPRLFEVSFSSGRSALLDDDAITLLDSWRDGREELKSLEKYGLIY